MDVQRIGEWSTTLKVIVEQDIFNVRSAYAPQVRLKEHLKVNF